MDANMDCSNEASTALALLWRAKEKLEIADRAIRYAESLDDATSPLGLRRLHRLAHERELVLIRIAELSMNLEFLRSMPRERRREYDS